MSEEKTCFIIMPITTPESHLEEYRDGKTHFKHVLDCLLIPSVKKAGFKPIPPIAKGSDIIQAEIIKNLEICELVLCDMSTLNPNVFFEFGIRTALNKPVCVVKDEITQKVPFDTTNINYHEYNSSIDPWELTSEIDALSTHIIDSYKRSNNKNTLWKYFGLKDKAIPYQTEPGENSDIEYIKMQINSINQKMGGFTYTENEIGPLTKAIVNLNDSNKQISKSKIYRIIEEFKPTTAEIENIKIQDGNMINIHYTGKWSSVDKILLIDFFKKVHYNVQYEM